MIFSLPTEIVHLIIKYCDLWTQLYILSVNQYAYYTFTIPTLYFFPSKGNLLDEILQQHKYKNLEILILDSFDYLDPIKFPHRLPFSASLSQASRDRQNFSDVPIIKNKISLKILYARGNGIIGQKDMPNLDLVGLYVCDNPNINDVSHLKNLQVLDASSTCGIDQRGIDGLDLTKLYARNNKFIVNVSYMKNLLVLSASGMCGIDQNGIQGLNLIKLYANGNSRIYNVSAMQTLKKLYVGFTCGIGQDGICGLDLIVLCATDNSKIRDVSFMKNLKILFADGNCGIDQNGIRGLNLVMLHVGDNVNVCCIYKMEKLKLLLVPRECNICSMVFEKYVVVNKNILMYYDSDIIKFFHMYHKMLSI